MTSDAKISANQANSAKSTGPVTPEGKETVSGNSVKHGLSGSGKHGIPSQERADLAKLLDELIDYYKPVGPEEDRLVVSVAENTIRVRRAHRMEAALFADALRDGEQGVDPDSIQARAWVDPSKGLQRMALYASRIQRTLDRDIAKLTEIQTARKAACAKAQEERSCFANSTSKPATSSVRPTHLEQARARFADPSSHSKRAKSDAAALRELEALVG